MTGSILLEALRSHQNKLQNEFDELEAHLGADYEGELAEIGQERDAILLKVIESGSELPRLYHDLSVKSSKLMTLIANRLFDHTARDRHRHLRQKLVSINLEIGRQEQAVKVCEP